MQRHIIIEIYSFIIATIVSSQRNLSHVSLRLISNLSTSKCDSSLSLNACLDRERAYRRLIAKPNFILRIGQLTLNLSRVSGARAAT